MNKLKVYFSRIVNKLKKGLPLIFWVLLFIIVIVTLNVIRNSFKPLSNLKEVILDIKQSRSVRLNFESYQKVVDRIEQAKIFVPSADIADNPFGVK